MSILQQIRDKAAWLVFGLIALSLVGFLLMDAFVGRSRIFGNKSTVIGVVNGNKIEDADFQSRVSAQEEQAKASGYPMNDAVQQNIKDGVWNEMIEDAILSSDIAALGIDVSDKEINDMLVGTDASPDIRRAFTDPKTGMFDSQAAAARINQLRALYKSGPKKTGDNSQYEFAKRFFEEGIPQIIKVRLKEKYMALLTNSSYVPKWMVEKMNADNSQLASVSYVNTPYFTIPDSSVKISDEEISEYVGKHPDQFKQEESRSLAYVTFDASPSKEDSAKLKKEMADKVEEFKNTKDINAFLGRYGTQTDYADAYFGKNRIQIPVKDSIFALPKGGVFGPYLDGGDFVDAKLVDIKTLPDSVKVRHILVATTERNGQQIRDDSSARKRLDSAIAMLNSGQSWDSVAAKISDDPGSKDKGGLYDWFASGNMVKEFNDFAFEGKVGDKKIVKTSFGYHYIEILGQKDFEPAYKIAYFSKKIETSPETDQAASGLASQFAGESRDAKSFDDNLQKTNLHKSLAPDIHPAESNIPGLGINRQLVRWLYDNNVGAVSEPYAIGDKYVVAIVTEINNEGPMSAAKARLRVEPILRNKKKAEQITKKLGSPASLDAVASASNTTVLHADSLFFGTSYLPNNGGMEPKVVGASFDKQLTGKAISPAIAGNSGVFFIKVENIAAISNPAGDVQQQRFMLEQRERQNIGQNMVADLKKLATIKDDRGKFY